MGLGPAARCTVIGSAVAVVAALDGTYSVMRGVLTQRPDGLVFYILVLYPTPRLASLLFSLVSWFPQPRVGGGLECRALWGQIAVRDRGRWRGGARRARAGSLVAV